MLTFEQQQKERNLEAFASTVALYSVLKANSMSLRVKQVVYRADEAEALPVDFLIDVELKTKRAVGQRFYDMFLRAVYNENLDLLSETLREKHSAEHSFTTAWDQTGHTQGSITK